MTKKHLEEKVEDLAKRLQGNEEKLAVYERRTGTSVTVLQSVDENLPREQQLEAEVAELRSVLTYTVFLAYDVLNEMQLVRSALKVTEVDLASAKEHVQQYQEISKANEEALSNLSNTFDEYKASTEAQVARHEVGRFCFQLHFIVRPSMICRLRRNLLKRNFRLFNKNSIKSRPNIKSSRRHLIQNVPPGLAIRRRWKILSSI